MISKLKNKIGHFIWFWSTLDCEAKYQRVQYEMCKDRLTWETVHSEDKGVSSEDYGSEIIVSLTTYGKRLYEVYISIESIMQGTLKPNRIILWLQKDYEDMVLPITLQNQMKRGLEVRYCEDIKSYKKLIPALQNFPDAAIITIDDDLIYPYDMVENLVVEYQNDPSYIYASRYHGILFDKNGQLKTYKSWKWNCADQTPSYLNFVTTGAGTLFPPHCFRKEIFNAEVFMELCPRADDVWVNAMAMLSEVKVKKVFTHDESKDNFLTNENVQDTALCNENLYQDGNTDLVIKVYQHYNILEKLKTLYFERCR